MRFVTRDATQLAASMLGSALTLALAVSCGSDSPKTTAASCKGPLDCTKGEECDGETQTCRAVDPLTIEEAAPPTAIVGKPYVWLVKVSGGAQPYKFRLPPEKVSSGLEWLRMDEQTGALTGTPTESTKAAVPFEVFVEDSAQQDAAASFRLRVEACADGEAVTCFADFEGGCGEGKSLCRDGKVDKDCTELAPSLDPMHCGEGCRECDDRTSNLCLDGQCGCGKEAACSTGQTCCGTGGAARCVDTDTDPEHCGECGASCQAGEHAVGICESGNCQPPECEAGWGACDDSDPNACTTSLIDDDVNCGACDNVCPIPQRANRCADGICACGADARICTLSETCCSDGCADLAKGRRVSGGIADCGACGAELCADPGPHGVATCENGVCGAVCDAGVDEEWVDCNVATGGAPVSCDVDLKSDPEHCGTCAIACAEPENPKERAICKAGACEIHCVQGSAQCDAAMRQVCAADGKWNDDLPCTYGCKDGVCYPECTPATRECINELTFRECNVAGNWAIDSCGPSQRCENAGICVTKKTDGAECTLAEDCVSKVCATYYSDADGDGFGATGKKFCGASPPSGYVAFDTSDCCDADARAKPDQTAWFADANNCGNYDYDCKNGVQARFGGCGCESGSSGTGYVNGVPNCGLPADWGDCIYSWEGWCAWSNVSSKKQECH